MAGDETNACQREPGSLGIRVWRTEDTICTVRLVYRSLVLSLALSHSIHGCVIGSMLFETKYSFNFLRVPVVAGVVAGASSLVLETRLPVAGLRNVSSSRHDVNSRFFNPVARLSDETSLSVVSALKRPVSACT